MLPYRVVVKRLKCYDRALYNKGNNMSHNPHKNRKHKDYVLSESNQDVITTIDGIVTSALMVSHHCPTEALEFIRRNGGKRDDDIMGKVIRKLETMQENNC